MLSTRRLQWMMLPIFVVFFAALACENIPSESADEDKTPAPPADNVTQIDTSDWQTYKNETYQIALSYPENWQVVENPTPGQNQIAISLYPGNWATKIELPLGLHEDATLSYLVIYPGGLGTEYPSGRSATLREADGYDLNVEFRTSSSESRLFRLDNGETWAYLLYPQPSPDAWSKNGYIFAQYAAENFEAECYDDKNGEAKPLEDCDPLGGDCFVRKGSINPAAAQTVRTILESIQIGGIEKNRITEEIQLSKPLPNIDVESPLTVKGQAIGYWYFEGSFPIALYDADDNLLAETTAEAQGQWMTEDLVPFEATLEFDAPNDERGEIVLERANPSGRPENAAEYSQPVIFPPAE